jgi:cation-transporting ATPase 13A3/4/5
MSVIIKNINENFYKIYTKGSPEKIKELSNKDTIPKNFEEVLDNYTKKGFRVICLAMKIVNENYNEIIKCNRDSVEYDMIFLGFVVFENKIKKETFGTIEKLKKANLDLVMSTGDNILTAISVSKDCGIIDKYAEICIIETIDGNNDELKFSINCEKNEKDYDNKKKGENINFYKNNDTIINFNDYNVKNSSDINLPKNFINNNNMNKNKIFAITGKAFDYLIKNKSLNKKICEQFSLILENCKIFARMTPENKAILIDNFKEKNLITVMVGDGANDIGALKNSDIGVSLSTEEASIASNFISTNKNISCLVKLFCEGKASFATSIQCFKFMIMYSMIQYISVTYLLILGTYLSDNQFLSIDLFLIFPLGILLAR